MRFALAAALLTFLSTGLRAQDLVVYDDALQNGFQDLSFGGGTDFASTPDFLRVAESGTTD